MVATASGSAPGGSGCPNPAHGSQGPFQILRARRGQATQRPLTYLLSNERLVRNSRHRRRRSGAPSDSRKWVLVGANRGRMCSFGKTEVVSMNCHPTLCGMLVEVEGR